VIEDMGVGVEGVPARTTSSRRRDSDRTSTIQIMSPKHHLAHIVYTMTFHFCCPASYALPFPFTFSISAANGLNARHVGQKWAPLTKQSPLGATSIRRHESETTS
jgi:hypothetical protein